ncbi:hypothetical protein K469DRAFT_681934 [Zopfia rhizophila CBS 207.26]|uniref:Uncharacterized protein n=1 Tax=Zopfia rhizophila CBS 207.26 TaxID=1314779 RepID=A0A6A6F0J9_9PEZI|nr:hypothetical protein K469DRAFT_681934 [Zopfia rhizophila CBS 207.26]
MSQYHSVPPSSEAFSPTSPYSAYTPSSTDSYSSQHPLFSPKVGYAPADAQFTYPQSPSGKGYTGIQQPFNQYAPAGLPPRRRKLRYRVGHHIQRLWLWETSACVVAVCAHFAMIALLGVYDGARVSSWTKPWTLNSNISLMITVIKGAAMIPVAGSLGQLKWKRFWTYRGLSDMDIFDDASRGTLGSLRLVWHLKGWHFASFGALLTITALTMDTLAQNVVGSVRRLEVTGGIATIPRTNNYATWNMYTTGEEPGDQLPWPEMVTAMNYGMSFTASFFQDGSVIPFTCKTGNCTFGPYQSLIVDHQCHDITDRLNASDDQVVRIPNGPFLRKKDGLLNVSSSTEYPSNDLFKDIGPLILNFQAITNPNLEKPIAIQCALYWSVSTFTTSNVTNQTLYELADATWTNTSEAAKTSYNQTKGVWLIPPECYVNGTQIEDTNDQRCQNWVSPLAQLGLQNFLIDQNIGMQGEVYKTEKGWRVSNLFANSLWSTTAGGLDNETYHNMELTMSNTAIMMSQTVRQLPTSSETDDWTYAPATGTVYQYEEFYDIHFNFLAVTHFVVGGSFLFLVLTIFLTRCDHPWKTSSLPLLFHGLTQQDRNTIAEVPRMVDMVEAASQMKVKMTMTPMGQKLATRETIATG